ncbi:MAG: hypothetical protein RIQ79_1972, partial [Verrucomicrobiota bacterium]
DAFAAVAEAFYKENGIAARFVSKPRHATGTAAILVNDEGQNEIVVALGANGALGRADLPPALFAGAKVVVTQLETSLVAVVHTLRAGRRSGAITVLNPAPMRADFDPALLKFVDILIPNETEFVALVNQLAPAASASAAYTEAQLAAEPPARTHARARALGVATVIVTLGKRGCLLSQATGFSLIAGHRVKAVDTTGAGDAFVGGFAAGLVEHGGDVAAAAGLGQAVAALSVTKPGTAPSMPWRHEVQKFLKTRA